MLDQYVAHSEALSLLLVCVRIRNNYSTGQGELSWSLSSLVVAERLCLQVKSQIPVFVPPRRNSPAYLFVFVVFLPTRDSSKTRRFAPSGDSLPPLSEQNNPATTE